MCTHPHHHFQPYVFAASCFFVIRVRGCLLPVGRSRVIMFFRLPFSCHLVFLSFASCHPVCQSFVFVSFCFSIVRFRVLTFRVILLFRGSLSFHFVFMSSSVFVSSCFPVVWYIEVRLFKDLIRIFVTPYSGYIEIALLYRNISGIVFRMYWGQIIRRS